MNLRHLFLLTWLSASCLVACKHPEQDVTPGQPGNDQPESSVVEPTDVGQPQGTPITQTVGPEGGTISTPDGTVKLVLPAGAVTKAMLITIQPITNKAPNGVGMSYRFSPDGTTFAKPATLTFQYKLIDVSANDPDLLQVGYQGNDNRWVQVADAKVDTASKQISVSMPHFSDWSAYEIERLELMDLDGSPANGKKLKLGESLNLALSEASWLEPLTKTKQTLNVNTNAIKWSVVGGGVNGQITGKGDKAVYIAPNQIPPQNPVTVIAEISFLNSPRKAYLLKTIYIETGDYFRGTIDGNSFDWPVAIYTGIYDKVLIVGGETGLVPNIQISIYHGPDDLAGFYPYTDVVKENRAILGYRNSSAVGDGNIIKYYDCPDGNLVLSPGGVRITSVERKDGKEVVEGSFTATVFKVSGRCPDMLLKKTELTGSFHITRTVSK